MMLVQQMRTHLEGPVLNVARTHHTILRFPQLRDPLILSISKALLSGLGPTQGHRTGTSNFIGHKFFLQ